MPIFEDGIPLWNALHEFYESYVNLYYASDLDVQSDRELQAYWQFKCVPPYSNGLPPLCKRTLIDQISQAVFDVTGYHEFVGSAVEYVTDPAGLFFSGSPWMQHG